MHIETPGIQTSVLYWPAKVWKNPFKEYIVVIGYLIDITVFVTQLVTDFEVLCQIKKMGASK